MDVQEAGKGFRVSMDKLKFYEENGLLRRQAAASGTGEYSETELRRIGIIHTLLKAGLDLEVLKRYLDLLDNDSDHKEEQIKILRKQRGILLNDIHGKQQILDELDYMISELRKKQNT